jgi:RNA polymerase sigma-70 factor (ECF subfamily)
MKSHAFCEREICSATATRPEAERRRGARAVEHLARRQEQFEELIRPLAGMLYAAALRRHGNTAVAEDLVQETYLHAWKNFDGFTLGTNFKAWIFQILIFIDVNERRKAKHREITVGHFAEETEPQCQGASAAYGRGAEVDWETQYPDLVDDEQKKALDRLSGDQRAVLMRVPLGGRSYRECAKELGIPLGTMMSRLFRARNQLRAELYPHIQ